MKNLISTALKSTSVSDTGRDRSRGFTLIELMVTMVVVSIIMAAIYSVYAALTRSYTTQNAAADVQQAVRATIDFMAEDIMMAGLTNPEEDYGGIDVGISVAGSTRIAFNADRNMDGDTDAADDFENITYALAGDQLQITDNTGTESLIDNVVNLQFRYFKENDTDTPTDNDLINGRDMINYHALGDPLGADDRSDISTGEISITVEEPAGREGMIQRTYTTRVRRRNADL
jgi:prepilin-type N-terminal cleavage/methylation domain-containing protein